MKHTQEQLEAVATVVVRHRFCNPYELAGKILDTVVPLVRYPPCPRCLTNHSWLDCPASSGQALEPLGYVVALAGASRVIESHKATPGGHWCNFCAMKWPCSTERLAVEVGLHPPPSGGNSNS